MAATDTPELISLVIPVFNERESLGPLVAEIDQAFRTNGLSAEILFVDDGSRDGSWDVIRELAGTDSRIRGVRFRRNFGKAAALAAGFKRANGGVVMTLDADLQDDPAEIPRFLAAVRDGTDVVSGWKKVRHDPWHKVWPSRVFNRMVSSLTGVRLHDHNCGFKAYRADVLREVKLYGELHRFVPVLAAANGFSVGELVIHHRPRQFGRSKFGWRRFVKGFLDLLTVRVLTGFGRRPMHALGVVALAGFGVAAALWLLLSVNGLGRWVGAWGGFEPFGQLVLFLASLAALLFGSQALFAGLVAEYVLFRTATDEPYRVADEFPR